CQQYSKLPYTF
nr:immunoglobulin light chain junction region [Mus musculus]NSL97295.1 immunoglobulin light chain junction region [Mus musculus]NSL97297.1 immunoglobulin light chain junction region [Mus musculus]NSL97578.1 immunoglobulin light chain junction region [Mus musculus]NSL97676.1 immunoglobulin light chain junction region [Mus musculus]